jgi:hypothetical protein
MISPLSFRFLLDCSQRTPTNARYGEPNLQHSLNTSNDFFTEQYSSIPSYSVSQNSTDLTTGGAVQLLVDDQEEEKEESREKTHFLFDAGSVWK